MEDQVSEELMSDVTSSLDPKTDVSESLAKKRSSTKDSDILKLSATIEGMLLDEDDETKLTHLRNLSTYSEGDFEDSHLKGLTERLSSDLRTNMADNIFTSLATYLPVSVVKYLSEVAEFASDLTDDTVETTVMRKLPFSKSYDTVVLFVDVSGFTALSEWIALTEGDEGAGLLAHHLNSYLAQIVKCIASQGGDVFKFVGDAMIVLWPPDSDDLTNVLRKATQSAIEIQRKLSNTKLAEDVVLNVKIGIGVGLCSIVLVGGVRNRIEYFSTGSPLDQAFNAEHHAEPGDIVLSPEAWEIAKDYFLVSKDFGDGFVSPKQIPSGKQLPRTNIAKISNIDTVHGSTMNIIKNCVPGAVQSYLNTPMERWISELRRVAVLFINVGLTEAEMVSMSTLSRNPNLDRVQKVVSIVQACVYRYEGSLNKFMFDDKGSTLLAAFGLPPLAHSNDSLRAILSAIDIYEALSTIGLSASIGVTTGSAFCGVVGAQTRKEYSVLGDVVNLSARLMQHAEKTQAGVLCDNETQYLSQLKVMFKELDPIFVKGKKNKIRLFQPVSQGHFWAKDRSVSGSTAKADFEEKMPVAASKVKSSGPISDFIKVFRRISGGSLLEKGNRSSLLEMNHSPFAASRKSLIVSTSPRGVIHLRSKSHFGGQSPDKVLKDLKDTRRLSNPERMDSPVPLWILKAEITLPKDFSQQNIIVPTHSTISALSTQVLVQCSSLLPSNKKESDYVLVLKDLRFPLHNDNLRVDTIPVMFHEIGLSADRKIDLELVEHFQVEEPIDDGRGEHRILFASLVNDLLEKRKGSNIIVEAGMGYGKTRLVAKTLCEAPVLVCCTTGSSVESFKPLIPFIDVLLQIVDFELALKDISDEERDMPLEQRRRTFLVEILEDDEDIGDRLGCLNELLDLDIAESNESRSLTKVQRLETCCDILIALLHFCTIRKPLMIVFDDASWLDPVSWSLVLRIATAVTSVMLVLTTSPRSISYSFQDLSHCFDELVALPSTHVVKLVPLPNRIIYQIALRQLGVSSIPDELAQLLLMRSKGNGLVCKELIYRLRKDELIFIQEGKSDDVGPIVLLSSNFSSEKVPVPISMMNMLGTRLERLTKVQQLILKTASCIGSIFSMNLLRSVYPIKGQHDIENNLEQLKELGIIQQIQVKSQYEHDPTRGWGEDKIFEFCDGFMREVVKSRVLRKLYTPVETAIVKLNKEVATKRKSRVVPQHETMTDWFEVTKTSRPHSSTFKKRYKSRFARLTSEQLMILNFEGEKVPWRVINLQKGDAEVFEASRDESGRLYTVCVASSSWLKKNCLYANKRVYFYLSFAEEYQMKQWMLKLQRRISPIE